MMKNILRYLRGSKTQFDIAKEYGVSQQCWQSWESGRTTPPNITMIQMEREFKIPMEIIFFGSFNHKIK